MVIDQGMNIGEVKALAEQLKAAAGKFDAIVQMLNAKVGSTSWVGADATKFKNDWWPAHRARLQQLRTDLEGFAQSALNNATAQEGASDANEGGAAGIVAPVPIVSGDTSGTPQDVLPSNGTIPGGQGTTVLPAGRDWHEVQKGYDAWATGRFADPNESQYQCTGWANYRWAELGYSGTSISGHGGQMAGNAPGDVSGTPSLHAMASYSSGSYGHVMIVEEVMDGGNKIRVSEMNAGIDRGNPKIWDDADLVATADEYRDTTTYTKGADGVFRSNGRALSFAAFPRN